jgi:hypothetical protein
MKPMDMLIRSEIRQMLNEAGLHREGLELLIKDTIREIIEQRVDQVFKQGNLESMENAVTKAVNRKLDHFIQDYTKQIITDKLRWMKFDVNVTTNKEK